MAKHRNHQDNQGNQGYQNNQGNQGYQNNRGNQDHQRKAGLVTALVILALTTIGLVGCGVPDKASGDSNVPDTGIASSDTGIASSDTDIAGNDPDADAADSDNASTIKKSDSSQEVVYSSFTKKSDAYSYDVPAINIDSADVQAINAAIQTGYRDKINGELANEQQGLSVVMHTVGYEYSINDNVLSLVVYNEYPNDCVYYQVFNVDVYTGAAIGNNELLASRNVSTADFLSTLPRLYEAQFVKLYGAKEEWMDGFRNAPSGWTEEEIEEQGNFYTRQLDATTSPANMSSDTPIFVNSENRISVVANIQALAGAGSYYYILDTAF